MANQALDQYAETTAIEDTDIIAVKKDSGDGLWRYMTGANVKAAVLGQIQGYISGVEMANNGTDSDHDIDISAGVVTVTDGTDYKLVTVTAITKQIDANWAAGDDAGGFPSGLTLSTDTTYHVFIISKADGTVDAGFDTSLSAANLISDASAYTFYRRIGSIYTDGSSNIVAFFQNNSEFLIAPVNDYNASNPGTSAVLRALSVPTGIQVRALHTMSIFDDSAGAALYALATSPEVADTAPSATIHDLQSVNTGGDAGQSAPKQILTNTSAQIRTRLSASDADISVIGTTHGWIDKRDQ